MSEKLLIYEGGFIRMEKERQLEGEDAIINKRNSKLGIASFSMAVLLILCAVTIIPGWAILQVYKISFPILFIVTLIGTVMGAISLRRSTNKRMFSIIGTVINSIVMLAVLFGMVYSAITEIEMTKAKDNYAENLYRFPLPKETVVLAKNKDVTGSGGNQYTAIGFFANMELSTKLSKEEIIKYYSAVKFPSLDISKFPKPKEPIGSDYESYTNLMEGFNLFFEDEFETSFNGYCYKKRKKSLSVSQTEKNGNLKYVIQISHILGIYDCDMRTPLDPILN